METQKGQVVAQGHTAKSEEDQNLNPDLKARWWESTFCVTHTEVVS